jgi:phosphatidate cytidylyltransferase
MKRLLTAAVGGPVALAAVFLLPGWIFFVVCLVILEWSAWELVRLGERLAPGAPLKWLLLLVPAGAFGGALVLGGHVGVSAQVVFMVVGLTLSVVVATLLLVSRVPVEQMAPALGLLGFGTVYLALPGGCLYMLQRSDPWYLFLLLAIVWLGDAMAYYVGSAVGRHKMAPTVSPNKSWEGAAAGFFTGVAAALIWGGIRYGTVDWHCAVIGAVTAMAAQMGDLTESLLKRSAGVKDSGAVFPGHGGFLDRFDATVFGAPVLLVLLWLLDPGGGPR